MSTHVECRIKSVQTNCWVEPVTVKGQGESSLTESWDELAQAKDQDNSTHIEGRDKLS